VDELQVWIQQSQSLERRDMANIDLVADIAVNGDRNVERAGP
jgi:hypothetical protein